MEKSSVADVLRALATDDRSRSETARLRDVVDEVEAALSAGVKRQTVLDALNSRGFNMTLRSFESALYRIRKQRRGNPAPTRSPAVVSPTGEPATSAPTPPATEAVGAQPMAAETPEDLPQSEAGKTLTEKVMNTAPQKFSYKQLQKAKEQK